MSVQSAVSTEPVMSVQSTVSTLASDNAYEEVKKLLDEPFGAAYVVGNAFRDKLEKWPKIGNKDANTLQRFSDLEENQNSADSRTFTTTAYLCIY